MKKWIEIFRERILQILFVPSLLWAIVMFFYEEITALFSLIPGKEKSWLHYLVEIALVPTLFILFLAVITYCFYRFPSFLLVPKPMPTGWLILRLAVYAVIVAVVLAVVLGLGWWIFVESGQDPDDVQYGMATLYMAFFGSAFLTPVCTVILVWFSVRVKPG